MPTRDELTSGIHLLIGECRRIGARLTDDQWAAPGSEGGWTNKQILAHVAGVGGMLVPFITSAVNAAPGTDMSAGIDRDAMNGQIVRDRSDETVRQLVDEFVSNYAGVIEWLRAAPDGLLDRPAPLAGYKDMTIIDFVMQVTVMHGIAHLYAVAYGS